MKLNSAFMDASVQSGQHIVSDTQISMPLKSQYFEKGIKIDDFLSFLFTLQKSLPCSAIVKLMSYSILF